MKKIFKIINENRILYLLLLFLPTLILFLCAKNSADFAEFYALHIYRYISLFFNFLSSLFPFSLGEILVVSLPVIAVVYILFCVVQIIKDKKRRIKNTVLAFLRPVCIASLALFLFMINCGMNYYRYSFAQTSGLNIENPTEQELIALCEILAQEANSLRDTEINDNKTTDFDTLAQECLTAVDSLSEKYDTLFSGYSAPKNIILSHPMSYTQIIGIYFPFTFEANVNSDIPSFSQPFTMCHEMVHLRGHMREDEANFLAYLACMESDEPFIRYSGVFRALNLSLSKLRDINLDAYKEITSSLSDGFYEDCATHSEYWSEFEKEPEIAQAATAVNNTYLKANNQSDGVQSYGRMLDLLLAYYREK